MPYRASLLPSYCYRIHLPPSPPCAPSERPTDLPNMSEYVVRVPLQRTADDDEQFILIHVKPINVDTFDLALTSTDNRAIFSATMTHDRIAKSQADPKNGDRSLWEAVLRWVLLRQAPRDSYRFVIENLDLQAVVETDRKITITIRHNIGPIDRPIIVCQSCFISGLILIEDSNDWGASSSDTVQTLKQTCSSGLVYRRTMPCA